MKVPFPKNIQKWILSGMTLNLGPISLSIVQLLLTAVWVWMWLAVFNWIAKSWSTTMGIIFAIPVLILFLMIAFFKVSEMSLLEYISKLFRNRFFDTTKKFQVNFEKFDQTKILAKESKWDWTKKKIEYKENKLDDDVLQSIKDDRLL